MTRAFGILLLLLSAFVLFAGWASWDGMGDEAGLLGALPLVSAKELDRADEGDRVVVEGRTLELPGARTAPVSGVPAAWYRIEREHHWKWYRDCDPFARSCYEGWRDDHEDAGSDAPKTMRVRIDKGTRVLQLDMPNAKDTVARLVKTDSRRRDLVDADTPKTRFDYEIDDEYLVKPGLRVTVAGEVRGAGADRTIARVKGLSLVYQVPRSAMVEDLRGHETGGKVMVLVGGLLGVAGFWLLLRARRNRRPKDVPRDPGDDRASVAPPHNPFGTR